MDKEAIKQAIHTKLKERKKEIINHNAIQALFGAFADPIGALGKIFLGRRDVLDTERTRIEQDIIIDLLCKIDAAISEAKTNADRSGLEDTIFAETIKQFDAVNKKLSRIEFLHDCNETLSDCKVIASLKQKYTPLELGHFRILFHFFIRPPQQYPIIWISGRDCYSVYHKDNQEIQLFGTKSLTWLRNPDDEIQNTIIGASQLTNEIEILGNIQTKSPIKTLGDFKHWLLSIYVTKPLVEKLNYITLIANDYILVYLDDISYDESSPLEPWPEALTEEEQKIPWVSILTEFIDFSIYTPYKIIRELK